MNSGRLLQARDLSEADLPWCYDLMLRGRDQVTCDYGYPTLRRPLDFSVEILARRQLLTGFAFGLADRPIGFLRIGEVTHTGYGAVCWLVDQSAMPSQLFYDGVVSTFLATYLDHSGAMTLLLSSVEGGIRLDTNPRIAPTILSRIPACRLHRGQLRDRITYSLKLT